MTLLPFTLLAVAAAIEGINLKPFWTAATVIWSLAMLFTITALTSRAYDEQQLAWDNADRAAIGKPFACVAGPKHWAEYHGAFDDWISAGAPGLRPAPTTLRIGEDPFHDPFYAWMNQTQSWQGCVLVKISGIGSGPRSSENIALAGLFLLLPAIACRKLIVGVLHRPQKLRGFQSLRPAWPHRRVQSRRASAQLSGAWLYPGAASAERCCNGLGARPLPVVSTNCWFFIFYLQFGSRSRSSYFSSAPFVVTVDMRHGSRFF